MTADVPLGAEAALPRDRDLVIRGVVAGLIAGAIIGVAMRVVETSRIAFGPYALYGNGAFAVPGVLVPVAIFVGWTWLVRMRPAATPAWALVANAAALDLAFGLSYVIAAGLGPQRLLDPIGLLFSGSIWVIPTVVWAGFVLWLFRSARVRPTTLTLAAGFIGGFLIGAIPPFAFFGGLGAGGISTGAGVVAARRTSVLAAVALGGAVAIMALVQTFALPLLFYPAPPPA